MQEKLRLEVKWVSFDQYQSADSIQLLRYIGITSGVQSMHRTTASYEILRQALYDGRVQIPRHDKLLKELQELEFDAKRNKIDHLPAGSDDCADALAGVVFGLTQRLAPRPRSLGSSMIMLA